MRTVIIYVLLSAALRLMGKRQIGEMQPSELVVAIMISDLASVPMQNSRIRRSGRPPKAKWLTAPVRAVKNTVTIEKPKKKGCGYSFVAITEGIYYLRDNQQKELRPSYSIWSYISASHHYPCVPKWNMCCSLPTLLMHKCSSDAWL